MTFWLNGPWYHFPVSLLRRRAPQAVAGRSATTTTFAIMQPLGLGPRGSSRSANVPPAAWRMALGWLV